MWLAKDNVGVLDTVVRSIVSTVIFALALEEIFPSAISVLMIGVSLLIWVTCVVGLCPLYSLLGISTFPAHKAGIDDSTEPRW
jgi:hypothetical protein